MGKPIDDGKTVEGIGEKSPQSIFSKPSDKDDILLKQSQEDQDIRLKTVQSFFKWVARVFSPVIIGIIILAGVKINCSFFTFNIPYILAAATITTSIISVGGVAACMMKYYFYPRQSK